MKTIAFTDWHEISFNGKNHMAQITIVLGSYYLTLKDPTRIFLIEPTIDSKKVDVIKEITIKEAREAGISV